LSLLKCLTGVGNQLCREILGQEDNSSKQMRFGSQHSFKQISLMLPALGMVTMLFLACGKSPSRSLSFKEHDQEYYVNVAQACITLLSQTNRIPGEQIVKGDDKSLPPALLDVHATKIKIVNNFLVGTNYLSGVTMIFGDERPDFVVSWEQNDYGDGHHPWELSINDDVSHTIVFSTNN